VRCDEGMVGLRYVPRSAVGDFGGGRESSKTRPTTREPGPGMVARIRALIPVEWKGVVSALERGFGLSCKVPSVLFFDEALTELLRPANA